MARINKHFFKMAQDSAKQAVELTEKHAGAFDWDIAMIFLKMAYYYSSVEDVEKYNSEVAKVIND